MKGKLNRILNKKMVLVSNWVGIPLSPFNGT